jgi:hypothetical protein
MHHAKAELWRASLTTVAIAALLLCAELSGPRAHVYSDPSAEAPLITRARAILTDPTEIRPSIVPPAQVGPGAMAKARTVVAQLQ